MELANVISDVVQTPKAECLFGEEGGADEERTAGEVDTTFTADLFGSGVTGDLIH